MIFTDKAFLCFDALKPKCINAMTKDIIVLTKVRTQTKGHDSQRFLLLFPVAHPINALLDCVLKKKELDVQGLYS